MSNTEAPASRRRKLTVLNVDLNLLVFLAVFLEEKSVTRTAKRMSVGQSAASNALNRLREVFDDPLLVRVANEMILTRRAQELHEKVIESLDAVNHLIGQPKPFSPQIAEGTITICATEYSGAILLPKLQNRLLDVAPGITLDVQAFKEHESQQKLAKSEVDFLIGYFPKGTEPFLSVELYTETFVCMMRKGHPLTQLCSNGTLSLEEFVSYPHLELAREGEKKHPLDDILKSHHVKRDIGLLLPNALATSAYLSKSDLIAPTGRRIAERKLYLQSPLTTLALPDEIKNESISVELLWERSSTESPMLKWFRSEIMSIAAII